MKMKISRKKIANYTREQATHLKEIAKLTKDLGTSDEKLQQTSLTLKELDEKNKAYQKETQEKEQKYQREIEELKKNLSAQKIKEKELEEKEQKSQREIEELKKKLGEKQIQEKETKVNVDDESGSKFSKEQMVEICKNVLKNASPWFGIEVLKAEFEEKDQKGVKVVAIKQGGPADRAGIKTNDVIELVNSESTKTCVAFGEALSKCKPGDIVLVQGRRGKQRQPSWRVEIGTRVFSYKDIKKAQRIAMGTIMSGDEEFIVFLVKKQEE